MAVGVAGKKDKWQVKKICMPCQKLKNDNLQSIYIFFFFKHWVPPWGIWNTIYIYFNIDKTRQDNALFGVLYSPMYIDFIQII